MYSEGNTYKTINRWTIYVRDSNNEPWGVLKVTEDYDEVRRYVEDMNDNCDYQRYAMSQHTK